MTPDGYTTDIAAVLGVSDAKAASIAALYPLDAYPVPDVAFATLVSDANFACPALQVDRWTSAARADLRVSVQRRQRAGAVRAASPSSDPLIRAPVHLRPTQRADPRHARRRSAGARRQHARGVGELRGQRRPVDTIAGLAVVHPRSAGDVPRTPAAAGLGGVRPTHTTAHFGRPDRAAAPMPSTSTTAVRCLARGAVQHDPRR